jgi:eukaryotic-like serine/threonine-protein kinase
MRGLHHRNAQVSVGLADVVSKCLAADPGDRYPTMAALGADLRRHLAHLPLRGVRNRCLREHWQKWRRRRPHGVALIGMLLAVLAAAAAVGVGVASHFSQQFDQARTALNDGQTQMAQGEWEAAVRTLQRGRSAVRGIPFQESLAGELDRQLTLAGQARDTANRAAAVRELHQIADRIRFFYGAATVSGTPFSAEGLRGLDTCCRGVWDNRARIVELLSPAGGPALDPDVRDDLLDLAIFAADLQVRLAPEYGKEAAHSKALTFLDEAEARFGPSAVLDEERRLHGGPDRGHTATPQTAWEHYALGRSLLQSGNLQGAAEEGEQAVRLQPQGLWPNFYRGLCAYRLGRYDDAVTSFSVCIGAAPAAGGCFHNRALALEALGRTEQALDDYDQALRLDPTLAGAALNRGLLHYRARRYDAVLADLRRARDLGADPAEVSFDLALVYLARGEQASALDHLLQALTHNPLHPDARKLLDSLRDRNR